MPTRGANPKRLQLEGVVILRGSIASSEMPDCGLAQRILPRKANRFLGERGLRIFVRLNQPGAEDLYLRFIGFLVMGRGYLYV